MGCAGSKSSAAKASSVKTDKNLDFLLDNTNFDEQKIDELYQGFIEECPDGKLTKKFLENIYKQMYTKGDSTDFCHLFFQSLDTKKKGFLTFTQFVLALKDLEGDLEVQLKSLFGVYDMNRNGIIDLNEMIKVIKAVDKLKGLKGQEIEGEHSAQSKATKIFQAFKKQINSKKVNGLNFDEFKHACSNETIFNILKP